MFYFCYNSVLCNVNYIIDIDMPFFSVGHFPQVKTLMRFGANVASLEGKEFDAEAQKLVDWSRLGCEMVKEQFRHCVSFLFLFSMIFVAWYGLHCW